MKAIAKISAAFVLGALLALPSLALESKIEKADGLSRIQIVTAINEVTPGESFYVGLLLDHEPGFHTYWRGPGIVGVATLLEWNLPEGFIAGDILWPPPQVTDMAGIAANGYETETCLLTRIEVPEVVEGEEVELQVKAAWMACATSCHPGMQEFSLTIPVNRSGKTSEPDTSVKKMFDEVLANLPPEAPDSWQFQVSFEEPTILLKAKIDGTGFDEKAAEFHFFCDDLQVNSDEPQKAVAKYAKDHLDLQLKLVRPDFAPKHSDQISGLLYSSTGWPGVDSKWVEISVPWPKGTFPNE